MSNLKFSIDINAPRERVWEVMLYPETYTQWTSVFSPGSASYYEGSWEKGGEIRFLGPGEDGKIGGMYSKIAENIPYVYIDIEHLGEIHDGKIVEGGDWAGGHETYSFSEQGGVTTLTVELSFAEIPKEFEDMFADAWPKGLQKLKELSENI